MSRMTYYAMNKIASGGKFGSKLADLLGSVDSRIWAGAGGSGLGWLLARLGGAGAGGQAIGAITGGLAGAGGMHAYNELQRYLNRKATNDAIVNAVVGTGKNIANQSFEVAKTTPGLVGTVANKGEEYYKLVDKAMRLYAIAEKGGPEGDAARKALVELYQSQGDKVAQMINTYMKENKDEIGNTINSAASKAGDKGRQLLSATTDKISSGVSSVKEKLNSNKNNNK